jgi:hypothetical protein
MPVLLIPSTTVVVLATPDWSAARSTAPIPRYTFFRYVARADLANSPPATNDPALPRTSLLCL